MNRGVDHNIFPNIVRCYYEVWSENRRERLNILPREDLRITFTELVSKIFSEYNVILDVDFFPGYFHAKRTSCDSCFPDERIVTIYGIEDLNTAIQVAIDTLKSRIKHTLDFDMMDL